MRDPVHATVHADAGVSAGWRGLALHVTQTKDEGLSGGLPKVG